MVLAIISAENDLQALILAGGFATRLRPLSCSKPKLLFPILGRPLIDHMIDWLNRDGVDRLILAVNHLAERLNIELGSRRLGSKIIFSVERTPLGTGGPLKLASKLLDSNAPLVVVNGDIVSDIDLRSVLNVHNEAGAEATVALVRVRDPKEFGTATLDDEDRIVKFQEKTSERTGPAWVNAGVYVLEPKVINRIPTGPISLERDIFPGIASKVKMQGWRHRGYWYDVGKISDYVHCNRELLAHPQRQSSVRSGSAETRKSGKLFHVSKGCIISDTATLGPYTILSENVRVAPHAVLERTIVFEQTTIGSNSRVTGSLIGENVKVGRETRIGAGSIVAGHITIPDQTVIRPGTMVLN